MPRDLGAVIVAGCIASSKVAVSTLPVTTLPVPFVLVGTFVTLLLGLEEITVGLEDAAPAVPAVPGTATTPGATLPFALAPSPPPPHPATNAVNSEALIHISVLKRLMDLFIGFPIALLLSNEPT